MKKILLMFLVNLLAGLLFLLVMIPAILLSLSVSIFSLLSATFSAAERKSRQLKYHTCIWTMKVFKRIEKLCE